MVTSNLSSKNVNIETVTSKLASTYLTSTVKKGSNGVPVGWGWGGPLLMMIGDAMTPFERTGDPFDPVFTVDVK